MAIAHKIYIVTFCQLGVWFQIEMAKFCLLQFHIQPLPWSSFSSRWTSNNFTTAKRERYSIMKFNSSFRLIWCRDSQYVNLCWKRNYNEGAATFGNSSSYLNELSDINENLNQYRFWLYQKSSTSWKAISCHFVSLH